MNGDSSVISLVRGNPKALKEAGRDELLDLFQHYRNMSHEMIRRAVIENDRIDLLAAVVLGYKVTPLHLAMMRFQFCHPKTLQLVFRGAGKCLEPGTLVMMADGSLREVERIRIGDSLMGPDSNPRKVLSLSTGTGRLLRVVPMRGDSWVCNDEHILSLAGRGPYKGKILDIPIRKVVEMGTRYARGTADMPWKLWRSGIMFPRKPLPIDPYFFGLWIGDGHTHEASISTADFEVKKWLENFARREGYLLTSTKQKPCPRLTLVNHKYGKKGNPIRRYLRSFRDKNIPDCFLHNSRKNRLRLLAGIIDTDGYSDPRKSGFEVTQKREWLAKQIAYLARSLGFCAYIHKKVCTIKRTGFSGEYYRVSISGDLDIIPCRIARKQAPKRRTPKDQLKVGFTIEDAGVGEFYGFTLDGDGRFLLGDFTVTHNSTTCNVTKVIHYLLKNPNLRICIASKSSTNAEGFLKEIKAHFESNTRLAEVFGPYFDPRKVDKWDNKEINILPRTQFTKESSVTCVGVEGAIVSKHYDIIISDDLIDEDNARTKHMRDKTETWFYKTLDPCLMPPDPSVPHRGEHHLLGTRYHFDDLYGHLLANEFKDNTLVIPALNDREESSWPEMYPPEWLAEKRETSGTIVFNSQYQCDTEAMKGEVFQYDDCQPIDESLLPSNLRIYQGIDLAISEKESSDEFADLIVGRDRIGNVYVLDSFLGHLTFTKQKQQAMEFYKKWDPIRGGVEANAYQAAFYQSIKEDFPDARFFPIYTDKDKMTRAWKLTSLFEGKKVFFRKGQERLIEQFVLFPNHRLKDGVDAFDNAIRASRGGVKRAPRQYEPGLI